MDCKHESVELIAQLPHGDNMWIAVNLLKRIPPLGELSRLRIAEEISA